MPTFDFRCNKCGHMFEFTRAFGSKAVPACPSCKSKKTEKLMSPPAIQFKGTGFYKTDSRATSAPKKNTTSAAKDTADATPKKAESSPAPASPSPSPPPAASANSFSSSPSTPA